MLLKILCNPLCAMWVRSAFLSLIFSQPLIHSPPPPCTCTPRRQWCFEFPGFWSTAVVKLSRPAISHL